MRITWGDFNLDEVALFDDVFRSITAQPWFGASVAEHEWLAGHIVQLYRNGVTDPIDLWSHCHRVAVTRFTRTECPK